MFHIGILFVGVVDGNHNSKKKVQSDSKFKLSFDYHNTMFTKHSLLSDAPYHYLFLSFMLIIFQKKSMYYEIIGTQVKMIYDLLPLSLREQNYSTLTQQTVQKIQLQKLDADFTGLGLFAASYVKSVAAEILQIGFST